MPRIIRRRRTALVFFPAPPRMNRSIFYDQQRARAQHLRRLFGADFALRRGRQFPGDARRDGFGGRHTGGHERRGRGAGRQRGLPVELSGPAIGRAGHGGLGFDADQRVGTGRSDLPLAVSGRRTRATDLVGSSRNCQWGNSSSPTTVASATPAAPATSPATGASTQATNSGAVPSLDLFSDRSGTFSSG